MKIELTLDFKELNSFKHNIKDRIDVLELKKNQLIDSNADKKEIDRLESIRIAEMINYRKVCAALDFFYPKKNSDETIKADVVRKHVEEALKRC